MKKGIAFYPFNIYNVAEYIKKYKKGNITMKYESLTREQVRSVIEGRGAAPRVPVAMHFWTNPSAFGEKEAEVSKYISEYPMDVMAIGLGLPDTHNAPADDPEYRWVNYAWEDVERKNFDASEKHGLDSNNSIPDWELLDGIIENFPKASYPGLIGWNPEENGQYRLGCFWFCFFERHWMLRGMENALTDYLLYPEEMHRLYRALTDFYKDVIIRGAKELKLDGVFTSDDIGTQKSTFFSMDVFKEFFKPYYKELIDCAHENGMHFWLHTCGNVEQFLPDFTEIGLDVIHPIQKYTMDEKQIAEQFGDKICFWAGFDVQQIIPYGTADDVAEEVKFMMDTYYRKDGRFMITAGNGITGDTPIDSLYRLYDECFKYGIEVGK